MQLLNFWLLLWKQFQLQKHVIFTLCVVLCWMKFELCCKLLFYFCSSLIFSLYSSCLTEFFANFFPLLAECLSNSSLSFLWSNKFRLSHLSYLLKCPMLTICVVWQPLSLKHFLAILHQNALRSEKNNRICVMPSWLSRLDLSWVMPSSVLDLCACWCSSGRTRSAVVWKMGYA